MAANGDEPTKAISLDAKRTQKFLMQLVRDPFIAMVVTSEGEVVIYSKEISPDHLARIKELLQEIQEEGK